MRALLDFLSRFHYWILFVVLEGLSFVFLFQFNHYHNSVWMTTANTVVGSIDAWERKALDYMTLGEVNQDLTRRNMLLQQNNEALTRHIEELTHDSTWAERRQAQHIATFETVDAHVITNSVRKRDNFITIDKGEDDGVLPEMGVLSGTGIVGIVFMTSKHFAIVQPLLNSHSSISCRLRDSNYFGYLKWDGDSPLYAVLDDIPRHARFKVGDAVETSGFSSVFPPGIFVGKVDAIEDSDDGLSYKLRIHLSTDFSRLQNVCVVRHHFHSELHTLEQQADSLANL